MFKQQAKMFSHGIHFMIDMETIGVERKPPIVQIAVTMYEGTVPDKMLVLKKEIDVKFSLNSQISLGRWPEQGAMDFWKRQDPKIIGAVFNDPGLGFKEAMNTLHTWFVENTKIAPSKFIWAMGALNDLDWLHGLYEDWRIIEARHIEDPIIYPFRYNQELCFRTEITGLSSWFYKKHPNTGMHNALNDAKVQGEILIDIINNYDQVVEELAKEYNTDQ